MRSDDLEAVQVSGSVALATAFGLFLDVKDRSSWSPTPFQAIEDSNAAIRSDGPQRKPVASDSLESART
jgi:hypothetical protein